MPLLRPAAEQVGGTFQAEQDVDGPDDQGLAGAGGAGEAVEAGGQLDVSLRDHREIADVQFAKHVCA